MSQTKLSKQPTLNPGLVAQPRNQPPPSSKVWTVYKIPRFPEMMTNSCRNDCPCLRLVGHHWRPSNSMRLEYQCMSVWSIRKVWLSCLPFTNHQTAQQKRQFSSAGILKSNAFQHTKASLIIYEMRGGGGFRKTIANKIYTTPPMLYSTPL